MRRVTPEGPGVVGGWLVGVAGGSVAVGSAAWRAFLTEPGIDTRAFTFPAATPGELHRAYREWRPPAPWQPAGEEQPYWYVRVRIGRKVRRFYLGAPAAIDSARLEAVAAAIAAARAASDAPS
jgi:hypothetical protein